MTTSGKKELTSFTAFAMVRPNGAGKSTLMNMITGYLAPTSGSIKVMEKDISGAPLEAKKLIGFLPEGSPLYPDMSVRSFLEYMAELRGFSGNEKKQRLQEIARAANIADILSQKIETLSKGYLRRVGFAQSIISNPPILLLDEPTDGLDPNQKEHIRELITRMGRDKTIIIDRAEDGENTVHFLNQVDEKDLLQLMEDEQTETPACSCTEKCVAGSVNTDCPVCSVNMSECAGKEAEPEPEETEQPEPEEDKGGGMGGAILLVVLLLAAAGGGAFYYFKIMKPKKDAAKGSSNLDDLDFDEDDEDEEELETEQEDEEV